MGLKMKKEKDLKIAIGISIFGLFLFLGLFIYACCSGKLKLDTEGVIFGQRMYNE